MKVIKTASGNQIKISKKEWKAIGKKAGWTKTAAATQSFPAKVNLYPQPGGPFPFMLDLEVQLGGETHNVTLAANDPYAAELYQAIVESQQAAKALDRRMDAYLGKVEAKDRAKKKAKAKKLKKTMINN